MSGHLDTAGTYHPGPRRNCPTCQRTRDAARGSTTARGYGSDHQKRRAHLLPSALGNPCPLCGQLMRSGETLDLDHTVPLAVNPRSVGDRIVHAKCNRAAGARQASFSGDFPGPTPRQPAARGTAGKG